MLILREMQHSDIEAILCIKRDPMVVPHQYRVNENLYRELLEGVLRGDNKTGIISTPLLAA